MRVSTLAFTSLALFAAALPAQGKRGPVQRPTEFTVNPATQDPTNLVVKFVEGSGVRLRGGQLVGNAGVDLGAVNALMLRTSAVTRLFLRAEQDPFSATRERESPR